MEIAEVSSSRSVGVVGLGVMGSAMASRLTRAGLDVCGFDANRSLTVDLGSRGRRLASLKEVHECADTMILSLPRSSDVSRVISEIATWNGRGKLIIDMSTGDPAATKRLGAILKKRGYAFVDAPVSGGGTRAMRGDLVIMVGGESRDVSASARVLKPLASRIVHVGGLGAGHTVKLLNNLLCAAHMVTTAEAVSAAEAAGVSARRFLEAVNEASGRSAVSEVNYPEWILSSERHSGFSTRLMLKDIEAGLCMVDRHECAVPAIRHATSLWCEVGVELDEEADFNDVAVTIMACARRR